MSARRLGIGLVLVHLALAPPTAARLEFEIDYTDAMGEGFFDETPRKALDDNPGTTLGEQRRLAFEHALEIWARALASPVPVRIEATFAPIPELPCEADAAVLGAARSESAFAGFPGAPRGDTFYPSPLADKLAGVDLDPMEPDLTALLNPRLDDPDCLGSIGWDYGFSGRGGEAGLVSTVLHELAHGLGFASLVDELTGEADQGVSIFDAFLFDRSTGLTWDVMTSEQRRTSVSSPYELVWFGEHVNVAATSLLARGAPLVRLSDDSELRAVSEPSFPPFVGAELVGELVGLAPDEACSSSSSLAGTIVLLRDGWGCGDLLDQLAAVARRGALGALTRSLVAGEPPWGIASDVERVDIPSLALAEGAFDTLLARLEEESLSATLAADSELLGTDGSGRVRLSASRPVQPGSSGSHWDPSVRRAQLEPSDPTSLLMEPAAAGTLANEVSDLTIQLLHDIGWDAEVCGNGIVDPGEECDQAIDNDDARPMACRSDCRGPRCGDGVVDPGEQCEPPGSGGCSSRCTASAQPESGVEAASGAPDAGGESTPLSEPEPFAIDAGTESKHDGGQGALLGPKGCACRVPGQHKRPHPFILLAALCCPLLWLRARGRWGRWPCVHS